MKNWRGYIYISLGLIFSIYRGSKVEEWGSWDFVDQGLALAMVAMGLVLVLRK